MGNKEIATLFYWVFKGAALFFLLIALVVFIALISSFVPVLNSLTGYLFYETTDMLIALGVTLSGLLSGGLTFAVALYFDKYIQSEEQKEQTNQEEGQEE